ncbi:hypothetical protein [Nonomuraea sp. WAC 01424]|uniref:hypothetical protein n=1 Tax=Nonomuraea sp. WAC 01424 TaxID=2203200 RepID=UPI000F77457B|nr:hypothetical protein [Nonomuraea sp. WAC 01424]
MRPSVKTSGPAPNPWKGKVPGPIRAAIHRAEKIAPVEVRPAAYSESELSAASDRLWAASGTGKGGRVHAVQMPFDGSGLTAAVEEKDKSLVRQALPDVGVPVQVVAQEPLQLTSRCDDNVPWYGGVAIANDTFGGVAGCGGSPVLRYNCTGGFPVYIGSTRYLLTAGHCGAPGDVFSDGAGQVIGVAEQENVAHDLLLIRITGLVGTGKGKGRMWDGTPGVNDFTKPVVGWGFTYLRQPGVLQQHGLGQAAGRQLQQRRQRRPGLRADRRRRPGPRDGHGYGQHHQGLDHHQGPVVVVPGVRHRRPGLPRPRTGTRPRSRPRVAHGLDTLRIAGQPRPGGAVDDCCRRRRQPGS